MSNRVTNRLVSAAFLFGGIGATLGGGALFAQVGATVPNWTVPPYASRSGASGITTMTDISDGSVFVAITPCRVVDTRGPAGPYGGPALATNVARTFDIDSGPCAGIPAGSSAYSLSIGAILPPANGFLAAWPTGTAQPPVSQLNFLANQVIANAAIVPGGTNGSIDVLVNIGPTHIYIDINGYFMDSGGTLNAGRQLLWNGSFAGNFMQITNSDAVTANASAIKGIMNTSQAGAAGVVGEQLATTGRTYGVFGKITTNISAAAGVRGSLGADPNSLLSQNAAGVLGTGPNVGAVDGVLGVIEAPNGGAAVRGVRTNVLPPTSGALGVAGRGGLFQNSVEIIDGDLITTILDQATRGDASIDGDLTVGGTKMFIEPHPTDASKAIRYVSLEGPESGTYFRGRGRFQNGVARIEVPEDFRMVTSPEGLTVQITPIGGMATVGVLRMDLNEIVAQSSRNLEFSYLVQGVRRTFEHFEPIVDAGVRYVRQGASSKLPAGLPEETRRRLIANGTYNPDGTVNMETAHRFGWDRLWAERSEELPSPEKASE
jgi:hypothetical protein